VDHPPSSLRRPPSYRRCCR